MSVVQIRGGVPSIFRAVINTTGRKHDLPNFCSYLQARAQGNPCKLYFTEENFNLQNDQYLIIPVANFSTSEKGWDGPVEAGAFWLQAIGNDSEVEIVTFQRRG